MHSPQRSTENSNILGNSGIKTRVSRCKPISVPWQNCGGLIVINNFVVLLFCALMAQPAFSAQHVALHPRSSFDSTDQETIRQIVDMERQSKEASLRRDAQATGRLTAM